MDGVHDLGGREGFGPVAVDPDEPVFASAWEGRTFALTSLALGALRVPTPAFRHAIERMDPAHYLASSYYEHWLTAAATLVVEAGVLDTDDLGDMPLSRPVHPGAVPDVRPVTEPRFAAGDAVRVVDRPFPGHTRCPGYVRGRPGTVARVGPPGPVPELEAHRRERVPEPTYTVTFAAADLWPGSGADHTVAVDLYDHDLRRRERAQRASRRAQRVSAARRIDHASTAAGGHPVSGRHDDAPSEVEQRAAALEALLVEKGLVDPAAIDRIVEAYADDIGPMNGARVVARAWVDDDYRGRLLADGTAAIAELGFGGTEGDHVVVVENEPGVHNVVVCTLCSCYPWPVLGLPPAWYKSPPYRSRMVREPRALLAEMGCDVPAGTDVRVWDSSAEIRYLVLPERPAGTNGATEDELAALVTRDAMIGVARL